MEEGDRSGWKGTPPDGFVSVLKEPRRALLSRQDDGPPQRPFFSRFFVLDPTYTFYFFCKEN